MRLKKRKNRTAHKPQKHPYNALLYMLWATNPPHPIKAIYGAFLKGKYFSSFLYDFCPYFSYVFELRDIGE